MKQHFELAPFFNKTPDLVCIAGKDGFFRNINPAVSEKLGYSEEELLSRPIASFIHPDDQPLTASQREKLLNGQPLLNFQNRYLAKDGGIIWLEWTSVYFPDREVVFAIAKDITGRKQAELDIEAKYQQFKSLATHFKSVVEENRKYLAIELHDELAQLAAVVKMDMNWVSDNEPGLKGASRNRLEHALAVTDLLINSIRRISFSLSPKMLADLGLTETLRWHCREFSVLNGIPCVLESNCDESSISKEIKLDFFRICQEALSNIMYHARASKVTVTLESANDKLRLSITDDGQGFEPERQQHAPGITVMRERAASINGNLSIESRPGNGTRISVALANLR